MAMAYTKHDRDLVSPNGGFQLGIRIPSGADGANPTLRDVFLGRAAQSRLATSIRFQFPPKIVNDSRRGDWDEQTGKSTVYTGDRMAVYKAAEPRQMTIEWVYIVDNADKDWTADKIHTELRKLRGYFRNPLLEDAGVRGLLRSGSALAAAARGLGFGGFVSQVQQDIPPSPMIIDLLVWGVGGKESMSFRMKSANIKHDKTIVGVGKDAFPLQTDVSIELSSWPKIGEGSTAQHFVPGQKTFTPDWF